MKTPDPKAIEDILALSSTQAGVLFHYLQDPQGDFYLNWLSLEVSGEVHQVNFKRAWDFVIKRHEMLRTVFRWERLAAPTQVVLKDHAVKLRCEDLSTMGDEHKISARLETIKEEERKSRFDLRDTAFRVILCKLARGRYIIFIGNHHILYDGWSTGIILRDFLQAYEGLRQGSQPHLPSARPRFKDFIRWQQNRDREREETFWTNYLEGFDSQSPLPIKGIRLGQEEVKGNSVRLVLTRETKEQLDNFAREQRVTRAAVFYCAWAVLLQRYCRTGDVVFGTVVSGRSVPIRGIENLVGLLINTIPLRARSAPGESLLNFLLKINRGLVDREPYENSPLPEILYDWQRKQDAGSELFDSIVAIENWPLESYLNEVKSQLSIASYRMEERPHYDLTVVVSSFADIEIDFLYNNASLAKRSVVRLADHFRRILEAIPSHLSLRVREVEILSPGEKHRLLVTFNETGGIPVPSPDRTIDRLFLDQVERTPDQVALVGPKLQITNYKKNGALRADVNGFARVHLSYRELNDGASRLADWLREKGVTTDTIVAIMVERSIEMVMGILGILNAGCAYVPLDPKAPASRLEYILRECSAELLLITRRLSGPAGKLEGWEGETYVLEECQPRAAGPGEPGRQDRSQPTHLAYVIFTSGSTGKPKGVAITHANFSPLIHWGYKTLGIGSKDRAIQNLAYYFDWSVWEIFIILTTGASLYQVPEEVLLNPEICIPFMKEQKITILHATPSQYQHYAHSGRKLETLTDLFLGAEKLTVDLLRRSFASVSEECRVFNMYGPTEATIISAVLEIQRSDAEKFLRLTSVPIGRPTGNTRLFILDKYRRICPVSLSGELVIGGDGVARGYLNQPELTAERFIDKALSSLLLALRRRANKEAPFGHSLNAYGEILATEDTEITENTESTPFTPKSARRAPSLTLNTNTLYKTGDLARWLEDGNIEFLGRMDFQVKIRGFRIEMGEIENRLLHHEGIREAVVTVRTDEAAENFLCAYMVPVIPGALRIEEISHYLELSLPHYMIPAHFVIVEQIPLTSSGKIDRKSLPRPEVKISKECVAPRNEVEKSLLEIWIEILGRDLLRGAVGIDANFFELGGHSLKATRLMGRIHKHFDIDVSLSRLFKLPTVRGQAEYIAKRGKVAYTAIHPVEAREYYPLSSAQRRLVVLQQMDPHTTVYNMPGVMILAGPVERGRLEQSFKELIRCHEVLRTSFHAWGEEQVQRIRGEVEFEIEYYSLGNRQEAIGVREELRPDAIIKRFIRAFDLSAAPLLRVGLVKLAAGKHLLMVDQHHIISDGTSMGVLIHDFTVLYQGNRFPVTQLHYKDYAAWQNRRKESDYTRKQEQYWQKEFAGEIPVLELPTDFTRPAVRDFAGSRIHFELDKETTGALKVLALETGTTLYMVTLALYSILLAKLSGQEDIVIGTPTAGRRHADLEKIIGMFINTLALRTYPSGEQTFSGFLAEVKARTLDAFENQDYQYEELVKTVAVNRNTARNPLFDTMFALQNMEISSIQAHGLKITPYRYEEDQSKFDISLIGVEKGDFLFFTCEYSATLFKKKTIERFILFFREIVSSVLGDRKKKLSEISIIPGHEKRQIVEEFNHPARPYPLKTVTGLLEEQLEISPFSTASFHEGNYLTVEELNKRVHVLANLIEEL